MQKRKTIDHIIFIEGEDRVIAPNHKDENVRAMLQIESLRLSSAETFGLCLMHFVNAITNFRLRAAPAWFPTPGL